MGSDKTVVLSRRLTALCAMVTPGMRVVDVGCDHGFADIYLVRQGISPGVLAMDLRPGPLAGARSHIGAWGLEDYITVRLSDGLQAFETGEAQSLICAGMGGRLMRRILEEGREKAQALEELILQPQSEIREFREYLSAAGYYTVQERALVEEGKYYFLMKAVAASRAGDAVKLRQRKQRAKLCRRVILQGCPEEQAVAVTEQLCHRFGALLLLERDETLYSYLEGELEKRSKIEERLGGLESGRGGLRLKELQAVTDWCRRAISLCRQIGSEKETEG